MHTFLLSKNRFYFKSLLLLLAMVWQFSISAVSQQVLDVNQVSATVRADNMLFNGHQYEVPKGSGYNTIYASNMWCIGRESVSQSLHGFADKYYPSESDTKFGPLKIDGTASIDSVTAQAFNRVWKINRADVLALMQAQQDGSLASGAYVPPADIVQWPGNGPAGYSPQLAPFFDSNNDGLYTIQDGDYPLIKGEQMLYWIFNDNSGVHNMTGLAPIGAEVHVSFYACKNDMASGNEDVINYTTFLEFQVFNRSSNTINDVYLGFNTDADIGYAMDDFTGSHVDANAFYFYSAGVSGAPTGSANTPVQSIQFLEGFVDTAGKIMSGYMSYGGNTSVNGDPEIGFGQEFYNYLQSYFRDGSPLYFGGSGYGNSTGSTQIITRYMFPGASDSAFFATGGVDPGFQWTQQYPCPACLEAPPGDVRGVGASGPFKLTPNGSITVVLGLLTTFDSTLTITDRVEKNRQQNKLLKQWYDNGSLPCEQAYLSIDEAPENSLMLYPNPTQNMLFVKGAVDGSRYVVFDINGKNVAEGLIQGSETKYVNVENLRAGLYTLCLYGNQQLSSLKFVKQ